MISKISSTGKMLLLSVAFSMCLLLFRFWYSGTLAYGFYIWNTFLALIPYWCSIGLGKMKKPNLAALFLGITWLLFLPNAPYLITDMLHYEESSTAPYWYDIFIVITAAWNGIALGLISLMNIEKFLAKHLSPKWVTVSVFLSLLLCSYGVFIGRFNRFNSWDIFTKPFELFWTSAHHILLPNLYPKAWAFTLICSILLSLVYFTLKKISIQYSDQPKA